MYKNNLLVIENKNNKKRFINITNKNNKRKCEENIFKEYEKDNKKLKKDEYYCSLHLDKDICAVYLCNGIHDINNKDNNINTNNYIS